MTDRTPDPVAVDRADYGLRFEADRQGLNLHTYDTAAMATHALVMALGSGYIVTVNELTERLGREKVRSDQLLRRACAAEGERDRTLAKVQAVLSEFSRANKQRAADLADRFGVLLHETDISNQPEETQL